MGVTPLGGRTSGPVLLDSHARVCSLARPQNRRPRAARLIDVEDIVLVSAMSSFEIARKAGIGERDELSALEDESGQAAGDRSARVVPLDGLTSAPPTRSLLVSG